MSRFEHLADAEGQYLAACSRGDVDEVREMLDGGVDVELCSPPQRWTGLMRAAQNGRDAVVSLLMSRGASLDARALDGRTALHVAAAEGRTTALALLLSAPDGLGLALIDSRDGRGQTPLHLAARRNHMPALIELVLRGADVDALDDGGKGLIAQLGVVSHVSVRGRQAAIKALRQAREAYLRDAAWRAGVRDALPGLDRSQLPTGAGAGAGAGAGFGGGAQRQGRAQGQARGQARRAVGSGEHKKQDEEEEEDDDDEDLLPSEAHKRALRLKRPQGWTVGQSRWSNVPKRAPPPKLCAVCGRVAAVACLCQGQGQGQGQAEASATTTC